MVNNLTAFGPVTHASFNGLPWLRRMLSFYGKRAMQGADHTSAAFREVKISDGKQI
jgi:hypothetical protein